jgi:hypothetical protein
MRAAIASLTVSAAICAPSVKLIAHSHSNQTWFDSAAIGMQGPSDPVFMTTSWVYAPSEVLGIRPMKNTSWQTNTQKDFKYQTLFVTSTGVPAPSNQSIDSLLFWNEKPNGPDGTCVLYGFNSAFPPHLPPNGVDALVTAGPQWRTNLTTDCFNVNGDTPFTRFDISSDGRSAVAWINNANNDAIVIGLDGQTGEKLWTQTFPSNGQDYFLSYGASISANGEFVVADAGVEGLGPHRLYVMNATNGTIITIVASTAVVQGFISPTGEYIAIGASTAEPIASVLRFDPASQSFVKVGDATGPAPSSEAYVLSNYAFGYDPATKRTIVGVAWFADSLNGNVVAGVWDTANLTAGPISVYTSLGSGDIALEGAQITCERSLCVLGLWCQKENGDVPTIVLLSGAGAAGASLPPAWNFTSPGSMDNVGITSGEVNGADGFYVAAAGCSSVGVCTKPGGDAYLFEVSGL